MMDAEARQAELDHMQPLIARLVDDMADLAVMRAAGIYLDRAIPKRDRLTALLALLRFAERGGNSRGVPGQREARLILNMVQSKHERVTA